MMRLTAIICLAAIMPMAAGADFTEETQFGTGTTCSVAWGDFDDGDLDMAIGNNDQQSYLYVNDGTGSFAEETQFGSRYTLSVAWGDYDSDGDLDLAVGNYGQQNYLYVNAGGGNFTEDARFGANNTTSLAWGDYDNDGDLDLAVGNFGQQSYLYVNDGAGNFTGEARFGVGPVYSVAWGDYDNDGDLDLAVGNYGQQNYLYVNDGAGGFTEEARFGAGNTWSIAWGDYDNDGDLDLAVGNWLGGQNYLYVNDGAGGFTEEAQFGTGYTQSLAWGDYDNDGDLDLAIGNSSNRQNYLYVNDGAGGFTEEVQFGKGYTHSVAWGDSDYDGDLDLAIGNTSGQENYLYVNNENDNDYLSVLLKGRYHVKGKCYSVRDGIGAKVLVYEDGFLGDDAHLLGYREIEANGGSCGQDSVDAEFGLPGSDTVEIRILWPGSLGSHITQNLIAGKTQRITVQEDIYNLEYPADGEDIGGLPLTLDWTDAFAENLEDYTVQISTSGDFSDIAYTINVNDSEATIVESSGLVKGTWWWRVLANYGKTSGYYSVYSAETWSFILSDGEVGINLNDFRAESTGGGIEVSWECPDETTGFNLYRSESTGLVKTSTSRDKLNAELITGESPYTYLDGRVSEDVTYDYWLEALDVTGAAETFGPVQCTWLGVIPTAYALYQSRPNPASGNATIAFDLPEDAKVTLTVYDLTGRKLTALVDCALPVGEHEAEVSGLAPGVYIYRLIAGDFNAVKKMVIVE
jgi:hypothetical protein